MSGTIMLTVAMLQMSNQTSEDSSDTTNSTLEPPIPNIIGLGVLFLGTLATIAYGYFHGNMHLITTLKNARG